MILLAAVLLAIFVLPSPWGVVVVIVGALAEVVELGFWWRWSKRRRPSVGIQMLVGRTAVVATACRPNGQVRLDGEFWAAVGEAGADPGDEVRVVAADADGLTLRVER